MRDADINIIQFNRVTARILILVLAMASQGIKAESPKSGSTPGVQPGLMHAFVANRTDGQPTKKFFTDTSKIYGIWQGEALKAGDVIQAIWIAESFGY